MRGTRSALGTTIALENTIGTMTHEASSGSKSVQYVSLFANLYINTP